MTRLNKFLICSAISIPLIGLASATATVETHIGPDRLEATTPPSGHSSPSKVVKADGFLFENFESVPDGDTSLPDGWIVTATPGYPDDVWHAGTLGRDGTPLNGVSGFKYAYILGKRTGESGHDSWLFSPSLEMKAGKEYTIEFFALMPPVTGDDIMEKLQVCICSGASASKTVKELEVIENDNDYWRYYGYSFTPETDGEYCVGFHSISPVNSNSTVIDDLKISSGPLPVYYGDSEIDLGTTDSRQGRLKGSYRISNRGTAPLEVSLLSASEGVTVEGLPMTVEEDDYQRISISASGFEAGSYEGEVVLGTNDLTQPTVRISLSGSVKQARVTGYHFEDFETGGPEGWDLSFGSGNVALYGGHESSRAYYTTTVYYDDARNEELNGVGFTTHYVEMGSEPVVSFWYQMVKVDFSGNVTGAAETGDVSVNVMLSDDEGLTYSSVYSIEPDGEHQHSPSLEWTKLTIPVPEYAGKTCRLRVVFNQPSGPSFFNQVRCMADDVEIGTKVANDLRATSLTGNALLESDNEYEFTATIENLGSEPMSDYKVQLIDASDNSVIDTAEGVIVEPSGKNTVKLHWTPGQTGKVRLNAVIVSDSDPIADNNTSYTHYVQVLPAKNSPVRIEHGETVAAMAFPVNFYAVESATQSIYFANEIGTTRGEINSLVFTSYLDADFYGEPFQVFIAETDIYDFSAPEFIDPQSFTKVFDGVIYMQSGTRDLVIPFDAPFSYNGGNIVVMCKKIGKEFVMGKYFLIHKCDTPRSIQSSSYSSGTIEANGYADASPADVYPQIRFNIVKADAGSISGTVTDENGPVAGALVRIKGTQRTETTDDAGKYSFAEIAAGKCVVEVEKHGYYTLSDSEFTLEKSQSATRDLRLVKLPRYTLMGTVTSAESGQTVKDVKIDLSGYDDFTVFTDDNGHYVIEDIAGDSGSEYDVTVSSGYFKGKNSSIDINGNKTADFSLEEKTLRAHDAKATKTDDGIMVTWADPMPEFRYDSGTPVDYVGWTHGNSEVIVGSAFHKKARIKEISWYVTDRFGSHSNFNVFIFGLDEEGKPNPKNILYVARNVEYTDNAWSTHIIGNAVEADGFMIAVSCDGFMGMGICEPSDEYPFNEGECFYAGDSYNMTISNMSSFAKVHPMLRAYGEDLDCANKAAAESVEDNNSIDRPHKEYKVYRAEVGSEKEDWQLVGTTESLNWYDKAPVSHPVFYAVVASYSSGDADEVRSNTVTFSSVASLFDYGIGVGPNPVGDILNISGNELIQNITILSMDGKIVFSIDNPEPHINVSGLSSGLYVSVLTLKDSTMHTIQLIKK